MKVRCPKCRKLTEWEGNEWRPFCSERCKLLDLGSWASGEYAIPCEEPHGEPSLETDTTEH